MKTEPDLRFIITPGGTRTRNPQLRSLVPVTIAATAGEDVGTFL